MIALLLSPLYRMLAFAVALLAAVGAIYAKGRKDAADRIRIKSYKETQDAIEKAVSARRDAAAGGLRDDDGFKRND